MAKQDAPDNKPSYLAAGLVSLGAFLLYLFTLAPTTAMWDTSEYITAAYTLGLPHPPGNPFFVLIGRVFSILPIASSVGARVNILAAVASAVSSGMWFLVTERVLAGWFTERWQRVTIGVLAALIGATSFTVWNQSVVNEKVYTVSLIGIAIISWLMIRWSDEPDGQSRACRDGAAAKRSRLLCIRPAIRSSPAGRGVIAHRCRRFRRRRRHQRASR